MVLVKDTIVKVFINVYNSNSVYHSCRGLWLTFLPYAIDITHAYFFAFTSINDAKV